MEHYNEPNYLKPLAFDRWRNFVQLRKVFKYWFGYCEKRVAFEKSDLAIAFDRWR
jgi:hypothetical protein